MPSEDWIKAQRQNPYQPKDCSICGQNVSGPFYYNDKGQIAHARCIEDLPDKDDKDLTEAILSDIAATMAAVLVCMKERNQLLKEKIQ